MNPNMVDPKFPEKTDKTNPNNYRKPSYSESYRMKNEKVLGTNNNNSFGKAIKDDIRRAEAGIKNEFRSLERSGERTFHDAERVVTSRKARKIEKIIIAAIYVVVILIGIYFLLATFYPDAVPGANEYTISASDSNLFNGLESFRIDDPSVLGEKKEVNGMIVRPIISSKKFNFVFSPKENIPEGKKLNFELKLVLNESNPGPIYVNDGLVFPDLTNYKLLKETDTDYIYVNNDIRSYIDENSFVSSEGQSTEDFIYKNMPGSSVWATRKLGNVDLNVPNYKRENTLINGTFRGDLKLAVYAENNLNIDFVKQDLNSYLGEDEYNVTVTDSNGKVVYSKLFRDDGDKLKSGKLGAEQKFNIKLGDLDKGVYYVNFVSDKNNDGTDSTLKNIKINSNKVLILGNFLPWDKFEFYTKTSTQKTVGFMYWWGGKDQVIAVKGTENMKISLGTNLLNIRQATNFTKGEYDFRLPKGYSWVYDDVSSSSKDTWLDLSFNQQDKLDNPNVLVIDKLKFNKKISVLVYNQQIDVSKPPLRLSLRALTLNSFNFKDANLIFG